MQGIWDAEEVCRRNMQRHVWYFVACMTIQTNWRVSLSHSDRHILDPRHTEQNWVAMSSRLRQGVPHPFKRLPMLLSSHDIATATWGTFLSPLLWASPVLTTPTSSASLLVLSSSPSSPFQVKFYSLKDGICNRAGTSKIHEERLACESVPVWLPVTITHAAIYYGWSKMLICMVKRSWHLGRSHKNACTYSSLTMNIETTRSSL